LSPPNLCPKSIGDTALPLREGSIYALALRRRLRALRPVFWSPTIKIYRADDVHYGGHRSWAPQDMRLHGLGLAFFLWAVASSSVPSQGLSNGTPQAAVLLAEITGVIGPATAHYAERAIEQARARQAEALIFRLDTPGGLLTSTREIIKAIISSPVPIIGFVAPSGAHAASAGTYILYATSCRHGAGDEYRHRDPCADRRTRRARPPLAG
jgi:hypothetical protein